TCALPISPRSFKDIDDLAGRCQVGVARRVNFQRENRAKAAENRQAGRRKQSWPLPVASAPRRFRTETDSPGARGTSMRRVEALLFATLFATTCWPIHGAAQQA